jgi:hypothetical protein
MTTYDTPPVNEPTPSEHIPPVPPHDDGDEPDFTPRPRKRARPLSYVLAGLALMALGTVTGIVIQKHEGRATTSTTSATGRSFSGARGTGGTSNGGTGSVAGGGSGGGTVGTVTLVDGNNVYVTDATGNVVKVMTNAASQLTKTDPATIKDVRPGETVIVRGTSATDGSVTATSLTASPAGSTGGFGRSSAGASTPTGG